MMSREIALVRQQAGGKHVGHPIARERSAGDGVHLVFGIFDLFAERECDVVEGAVGKYLLADKLLLEFLFHDARTETGCFTLVSEIGTINGFEILFECQIARDTTPKSATVEGYYVDGVVVHLGDIEGKALGVVVFGRDVFRFYVEATCGVNHLSFYIEHRSGHDVLLVRFYDIRGVANVECSQDLSSLVVGDVLILLAFERRGDECQQEGGENHQHRGVDERIYVAVGIEFHCLDRFIVVWRDASAC